MPRAYYKPFTAYEEAFGFHATRRNAYFFCMVLFSGILFKCVLAMKFSTVVNPQLAMNPNEEDPRYQAIMDQRLQMLEQLGDKDSMKRAIKKDTSRRVCSPHAIHPHSSDGVTAFENDVRRLRLLATLEGVPGGYANEEPTEEEMQDVEADEEMQRLHQLFVSKQQEEDIEEEEADVFAEEAEAQAELVDAYRVLIHDKLRWRAISARLNEPGLLHAGGTTAATSRAYGVLFQAREGPVPSLDDGDESAAADVAHLTVHWKPSKRSTFTATPLHWAVLGRAHDAIRYLILNGADTHRGVGQPSASDPQKTQKPVGDAANASMAASSSPFPAGLTAETLARDNASYDTLRVLKAAVEERTAAARAGEEKKRKIESELEQIKAKREKRRLELDQRRTAAEEAEETEEREDDEQDYEDD